MKRKAIQILAFVLLTASAFAVTPTKKVLVIAQKLDTVAQGLINGLKAEGFEIVLIGPTDVDLVEVSATGPYRYEPTKTGSLKADYCLDEFPIATVREYSAFLIPNVSVSGLTLTPNAEGKMVPTPQRKLLTDAILSSGKLVIFGESPATGAGERLFRGEDVVWNFNTKAYQINGGAKRINYIVYRRMGAGSTKKTPDEDGNHKFIASQLLPRVLSKL